MTKERQLLGSTKNNLVILMGGTSGPMTLRTLFLVVTSLPTFCRRMRLVVKKIVEGTLPKMPLSNENTNQGRPSLAWPVGFIFPSCMMVALDDYMVKPYMVIMVRNLMAHGCIEQ